MTARDSGQIECDRLTTQRLLDDQRSAKERNRLGQFATPSALALEVAQFVRQYWEDSVPIHFADPAIGTGAFFAALLGAFGPDQIASATGVELDERFVATARDLWEPMGLDVLSGDFTQSETLSRSHERPNLILTNPPYVRHHHMPLPEKQRLQAIAERAVRLSVNGLAGLYVYFVLIAHEWMQDEGLAAWLIPSEFMDVNYGVALRRYLREQVTLLALHRFDPREVQFDDALVSSAVVVFRKTPPRSDHRARFTFGGSLLHPTTAEEVALAELREAHKWSTFPRNGYAAPEVPLPGQPALADFFKVQRGLVTGANEFFILERERARVLELPEQFLQPILPSPRYLRVAVVEPEEDGYPRIQPQMCLVNCDLPEDEVRERYPALWRYLATAEAAGILSGYLVRGRKPWYRQESRTPAPFVCTYMGRGVDERRPFRFIWNRSQAVVPNVYLMLYPRGGVKRLLDEHPEAHEEVFAFLQEICGDDLRSEGRVYGGGLHKIEPKELGRVSAARLAVRFPEIVDRLAL